MQVGHVYGKALQTCPDATREIVLKFGAMISGRFLCLGMENNYEIFRCRICTGFYQNGQ